MSAYKLYRQTHDPIMTLFFSDQNVNAIHTAILDIIYRTTGVIISRQSDRDLLGIMQFVFGTRANTRCPKSIVDEVRRLNKYVIEESVYSVKSGMLMHMQYVKDASTLPTPIDRSVSTTEDKSLDLSSTFI